ncbi:unnamed protein product, partial [marine sediment metagenome]
RGDSANSFERLHSTLQSIRRHAHLRVIPTEGGYLVDVQVIKELEDVERPEQATASAASLSYSGAVNEQTVRLANEPLELGWIPLGRDTALEQVIISRLYQQLGGAQISIVPAGPPPGF